MSMLGIWLFRIVIFFAVMGGIALVAVGIRQFHDEKQPPDAPEAQSGQRNSHKISILLIAMGSVILLIITGLIVFACLALRAMT